MPVKKLITPLRVGLFVVAAGAFLFTFVMFARKGGLSADESLDVYALFRDASGLGPRSRVQIAGIQVGEITSITLEGTRARVGLRIRRDVGLREDAGLVKRSESLLGDFLLDLTPGTETAPLMPEGGQIKRVVDTQGMEAVFESLGRITDDIQQVTRALRDVLGGEKGTGSMERIVQNLVELSDAVDDTVRTSGERLNSILLNFEGVSQDVRGLTRENEATVDRIVANIELITRDTREVLASVKGVVGTGEDDLKESVASLKQTLGRLDRTLANMESVTAKVNNGEGVVGQLVANERLGQRVGETVEDVSNFAQSLTQLQVEVGVRSEYLVEQGRAKNGLSLRVIPKPDKYYLLEVIDDPRGLVETQTVQNNPPTAGEPVTQVQRITRDTFKVSLQFAKRYYFATLRFGLIESSGGVGADLHLLQDLLSLRLDAFNFSVEELRYPRVRATLRAEALGHLFVTAGLDDMLNSRRVDPATGRLLAGRDYFFGGGLFFTDDDLKAVLSAVPLPSSL